MQLELPLLDVFGRGGSLKSSWYGDCLPSPRLPAADRPLPAGPAAAGRVRHRDHRHRRHRRRLREDARRRGPAVGGEAVSDDGPPTASRPDRPHRHLRHLLPRRPDLRRRQQRVGGRRRRGVRGHRRPARRRARSSSWSASAGSIAVLCTHAHDDHVRVAPELGRAVEAPVLLHPADLPVWRLTHADPPDGELADGQQIPIADIALEVLHTPGHAPGAVCFYSPDLGVVFTGDTLFNGGPGRHRPVVQRPRPDRGLHHRPAARRCPTTPWSRPGTATTPPSARNAATSPDRPA